MQPLKCYLRENLSTGLSYKPLLSAGYDTLTIHYHCFYITWKAVILFCHPFKHVITYKHVGLRAYEDDFKSDFVHRLSLCLNGS